MTDKNNSQPDNNGNKESLGEEKGMNSQDGQDNQTPEASSSSGKNHAEQGDTSAQNTDALSAAEAEVAAAQVVAEGLESGSADTQEQAQNGEGANVLDFGQQRMDEGEAESPDLDFPVELDELSVLKQQLGEVEAKAADNWERVLRMQADMDNQRKRSQKDVDNARKFALEGLANELLPVKDSLEMGLQAATQDDADLQKIVEGSELTLKMLSQALEKHKISEINPVDERFNPELHQAMSQQEVEGKETNTVVAVLQKGYTLNDRLIRPALVMVAK